MQASRETLKQSYAGKTDEELRSLHSGGALTQLAYEMLEHELMSRGLVVPKRPDANNLEAKAEQARSRTTLAAHWRGQAPLASAYWLVGALGFWIVYAALVLTKKLVPVLMPLASLAMVAFLVFAWVSIWRCSKNVSSRIWGEVARWNVVLFAIGVLLIAGRLIALALQSRSVMS